MKIQLTEAHIKQMEIIALMVRGEYYKPEDVTFDTETFGTSFNNNTPESKIDKLQGALIKVRCMANTLGVHSGYSFQCISKYIDEVLEGTG